MSIDLYFLLYSITFLTADSFQLNTFVSRHCMYGVLLKKGFIDTIFTWINWRKIDFLIQKDRNRYLSANVPYTYKHRRNVIKTSYCCKNLQLSAQWGISLPTAAVLRRRWLERDDFPETKSHSVYLVYGMRHGWLHDATVGQEQEQAAELQLNKAKNRAVSVYSAPWMVQCCGARFSHGWGWTPPGQWKTSPL